MTDEQRAQLRDAQNWLRLAMSKNYTAAARRDYVTRAHKIIDEVLK